MSVVWYVKGHTEHTQIAPGLLITVFPASIHTRSEPAPKYRINIATYEHPSEYTTKEAAKKSAIVLARKLLTRGLEALKED